MANTPFAQFPGDFEALARQYWNTWNELLGRNSAFDGWGLAGGLPSGLGRIDPGAYDWYQRLQRLAADFSGGGSAADVAAAWREMLGGQGGDPFAGMLRSMHGGLAGGDWLEQMRPLLDMLLAPLRQQGAEWLQRPAFGPAREHQERLQALALAWQQWEQSNEAFNAQLAQAGQAAFARFEALLGERDAPGKRLESARALFDLWIDAAEDAWAEVALSTEYRHAYAEMTNALMRLRLRLQHEVEQFGALLGLPGRSELDALHRKVAELDRALHAARRASAAPRAAQAPEGHRPTKTAAQAAPARAAKPVARRAARPVAKAAAPKAPARRSPTRTGAARVGTDVVAPVGAQQAKAAKAATPVKATKKPAKAAKTVKAKPTAKKPDKATRAPVTAKPAATTRRKPAVATRKPMSAAKGAARPAAPATAPRKAGTARPVAAAARKPATTGSRRAVVKAAAKQAPQASTSTARKARVAKAGSARKAQPAAVPAAASKVVSMKDWVSRNLATPTPETDRPGGKRKGRSR